MGDLSVFMKIFKQCFTQWYNRKNRRQGTLWEDRFRSVAVEIQDLATLGAAARIGEGGRSLAAPHPNPLPASGERGKNCWRKREEERSDSGSENWGVEDAGWDSCSEGVGGAEAGREVALAGDAAIEVAVFGGWGGDRQRGVFATSHR
jgi:hypothetical protein